MIDPQNVIGKPLVVYIDGQRHQIGVITNAAIQNGKLYVGATLDTEPENEIQAVMEA